MNSDRMLGKLLLCTAGAVLVAFILGHWLVGLGIMLGIGMAFPVIAKIFQATERGDFPGFIEDVFPEEVKEVKRQQRKKREKRS